MTREDARETKADDAHVGRMLASKSIFANSVGESYMDPRSIFASPIRLGSYQWTTAASQGAQFFQYKVPEIFINQDTFHKTMLQTYVFFKPTVTITLEINATPQHMGLLCLWYDPFTQFATTAGAPAAYHGKPIPKNPSIFTTSMQPHVYIQAADSNKVTLDIPFEHPQTCLTTNSADPITNMGTIQVMIISPLEAPATSSSSVTVQMWLQFKDCELAYPEYPHTALIPTLLETQSGEEFIENSKSNGDIVTPMGEDMTSGSYLKVGDAEGTYGPPRQGKEESWWSKLIKVGGGVAGTAFNALTGNWGGAARTGAGTIADFIGLFMDKPNDPLRSVNNMLYPIPPLGHVSGVAGNVRLDANQVGGYMPVGISTNDPAEQKFSNLMKIPSMFYKFDWSDSQAPGDVLMTIPVTPGVCNYNTVTAPAYYADGTLGTGTYVLKEPTFLSYNAGFFRFWSGTMKYAFKFVTTGLHTGKVACTFIPNNYAGRGTETFAQATCANTEIFDVAGERDFSFTPPWMSALPRKSYYDWSVIPYSAVDDRTILGWITVRVAAQLTTTNAIPGTVHCFVYISAADDFFCESLMRQPYETIAGNYSVAATEPPTLLETQAGEEAEHTIDPGSGRVNDDSSVQPTQMLNVRVGDIRDACRRANLLGIFPIPLYPATKAPETTNITDPTGLYTGSLQFHANPVWTGASSNVPTIYSSVSVNPAQDMMAMALGQYVFYSGGVDFTFLPYTSNTNVHLKAEYYPVYTDDIDILNVIRQDTLSTSSLAAHMTMCGQQRALQVSCPYTSNYQQLAIQSLTEYNNEVYTSGQVKLSVYTSDITGLPLINDIPTLWVQVYKTFGDDGRASWPVAPQAMWSMTAINPL